MSSSASEENMARKVLYKIIMEDIKERIRNTDFSYSRPITTESEIMNDYGVSRITAIKALDELEREKIIVRKKGSGTYVSSQALNLLNNTGILSFDKFEKKNKTTKLIALVLPCNIRYAGMTEILRGVIDVMSSNEFFICTYNTYHDHVKEAKILSNLLERGIDGVICYPERDNCNFEIYNKYVESGVPVVIVDKYIDQLPISYVVSDNYDGIYQLCELLVSNGHRKIAFLSNGEIGEKTSVKSRYFGYTSALNKNGISVNLDYVHTGIKEKYRNYRYDNNLSVNEYFYEDFIASIIKSLKKDGVTAIVCSNDLMAIDVFKTLKMLNVSVPKEMSITGFDNIEELKENDLRNILTTVQQDFYSIGKSAATLLADFINKGEFMCVRNTVPVKLIERNSIGCIKKTISE